MKSKDSNTIIARALLDELRSGKDTQAVIDSLAAYLILEHRQSDKQDIVRELERLLLVNESKLYVHASAAFSVDDAQLQGIKTIFAKQTGAKNVVVQQTIDPDVIGGVRLQTADYQLDLTVRRQLQRLKNAPLLNTRAHPA